MGEKTMMMWRHEGFGIGGSLEYSMSEMLRGTDWVCNDSSCSMAGMSPQQIRMEVVRMQHARAMAAAKAAGAVVVTSVAPAPVHGFNYARKRHVLNFVNADKPLLPKRVQQLRIESDFVLQAPLFKGTQSHGDRCAAAVDAPFQHLAFFLPLCTHPRSLC
jgi:hypothetical protein